MIISTLPDDTLLPPVQAQAGEGDFFVLLRDWGIVPYAHTFNAMQQFTAARQSQRNASDELWLVEHPPVYTLGAATKPEHLPLPNTNASTISLEQTDRGGQITYHGPGQAVLYFLIDLTRRKMTVRGLVSLIENTVISWLGMYGLSACAKPDAPGVYIDGKKIASLGLKIRHGCSYHGLSVNLSMDTTPFLWIHPCGYPDLKVTQLSELVSLSDPVIGNAKQTNPSKDAPNGLTSELPAKGLSKLNATFYATKLGLANAFLTALSQPASVNQQIIQH